MATMIMDVPAAADALLGVYRPAGPVFTGGEGCHLIAEDGSRYLDFTAGIAVNALGYGDPDVAGAITAAVESGLIHASNLFRTRPAAELAEWLVAHSFADRVFFCNSGAEANEGALKFARRWAREGGHERRTGIVAFRGGFHGRTMGALAATDRPAYQDPFKPLVPGVRFCEVGDTAAAEELVGSGRVAAVIIEPLQGEGGVLPVPDRFLRALRILCDEAGALLVFDEVQCGLGRTGTLWAHEGSGVTPDILTVAKPLAGGLPMGAVLLTERVASALRPGDHATTFGGGPLVASAALAVCRKVCHPSFLAAVRRKADLVAERLTALQRRNASVRAVRGRGLLWGVEVSVPAAEVVSRAMEAGLLLCTAGPNVVRIAPPLVISEAELEQGIAMIEEAL
ncbi:MAG TPA: acetylornithine transaminase [Longimicrobium sp.]|nr:acetylornithine transaminase [Longimicrobium sp.]